MSENGIKEKILKIRQELENFSLSDQNSIDMYYRKTYEPANLDPESSSIINLAIPEDSKLSPIQQGSQKFLNRDYFFKTHSETDLKEAGLEGLSMKTDMFHSIKEQELAKHNKKLLANLHESRAYYIQLIAEKDDLIAKYREKIYKDENNINNLKRGCMNIEELKDSTRKLITESDKIEKEKEVLIHENKSLKEKIFKIENEFEKIEENFLALQKKFDEITKINGKKETKIQELKKENEFLYKTLGNGKKTSRNPSFSPSKHLAFSSGLGKSSSFGRRTAILTENEKTDRTCSPLVRSRRSRSSSKPRAPSSSHTTTCKIVKTIQSLLSLKSASEIIPEIQSLSSQLSLHKSLTQNFCKLQSLITQNSPPNTFKSPPAAKVCTSWVKRLVKEYHDLKSSTLPISHSKILNILKSGLSTSNIEDIPKAISKLLVENEKLLKIVEKVKKILKCGPGTSLEEFENELELRSN